MRGRRILYLDALRGFLILNLIWVHGLFGVVNGNSAGSIDQISPLAVILLLPFGIAATWAPLFVLISGTVNAYVMHHAMMQAREEGASVRRKLLLRGLFTAAYLYALSIINMLFLHHTLNFNGAFRSTLATGSLIEGRLVDYSPQVLFYNDALAMIAATGVVITILLTVIWWNDGILKPRRNYVMLAGLGIAWLFVSPLLHHGLDPIFYGALDRGNYLVAGLCKLAVGPSLAPFPRVAFGIFGAIIGIALAREAPFPHIRRFGYGFAGAFLAVAGGLMLVQGFHVTDLPLPELPLRYHCLNLGLMLAMTTCLIGKTEYGSAAQRKRFARCTLWIRRAGIAALSVYVVESLTAAIVARGIMSIAGTDTFPRHPLVAAGFLITLLTFFLVVLKWWERYKFRYGCEWLLTKLISRWRGNRPNRLDPRNVLHDTGQRAD